MALNRSYTRQYLMLHILTLTEMLGYSLSSYEAATNEPVLDVHGRELYLYLPYHDGWYDAVETYPSPYGSQD